MSEHPEPDLSLDDATKLLNNWLRIQRKSMNERELDALTLVLESLDAFVDAAAKAGA